ncbi:MAG: WYL domain-containing protein [Bradymonadaceae bacterium]|nr:WYL domain-containing protein [Lujinxingiaceae bacterium]
MSARNTFAATRRSHAILNWLQDGEPVTIERVCDTFGIKYPQAREDLKLLEDLYGLATQRDGRTKVWIWPGASRAVETVATAAALELGAIALDIFKDTPYGEEITRVSQECRRRLESTQDQRLDRIANALHLRRTWLPVNAEAMLESVEDILDAIYLDQALTIKYERADGELGSYALDPRRLIWYGGRLWLQAFDQQQIKLFDLAGIQTIKRIAKPALVAGKDGATVDRPALPLPAEYFADAFGIFAQNFDACAVHLHVGGSWATYLRRYHVHPSQVNEEKDGKLHVHFTLGLCPEFKSFLMGMIPDVKVVAPRSLKTELRARAAQGAAI